MSAPQRQTDSLTAAQSQSAEAFYTSLKNAAKTLDVQLTRDQKQPELADVLMSIQSSSEYDQPTNPSWQMIQRKRIITLPDALFEQYDLLQCRCFMGLFPEINRAWITVDHRLFLWNYQDGSDFYSFEDQDQVIVSVGLVKPRPGIFIDQIEYLLVLATPIEIILLGMSLNGVTNVGTSGYARPTGELTLYVTQMSVPSDNVSMTSIVGTDNGRIFMCGNDGHLYELIYQAEEGWFTRKCRKLNHTSTPYSHLMPTFLKLTQEDPIAAIALDDSRNVLYTLSHKSNIEVIYLGADCDQFIKVAKNAEIAKQAQLLCPTSPLLDSRNFQIVSIHPVLSTESRLIHLVAVTSSGCRLYFTHYRGAFRGPAPQRGERPPPTALELIHVRVPPTQQAIDRNVGVFNRTIAYTSIHVSSYSNGVFLAANAVSEELDSLLTAVPDVGRLAQQAAANLKGPLKEISSTAPIEGKTWAIAEMFDSRFTPKALPSTLRVDDSDIALNELATQLSRPPRQFLVLTNSGINVLSKQRPIDILQQLLIESGGNDQDLDYFFDMYGRAQACAMCLGIACFNPYASSSAPTRSLASVAAPVRGLSPTVVAGATRLFFEKGGKPALNDRPAPPPGVVGTADLGRLMTTSEPSFSGRHDGLALYFARVVRPIWKQKVAKPSPTHADQSRQDTNVPEGTLITVQQDLSALKGFLDQNPQFTAPPNPADARLHIGDRKDWEALRAEQESLNTMYSLLLQCIEAISFMLLLIDYKLPELIGIISPASQAELKVLTYENLLTTVKGRELCRDLVTAVIHRQIGQHINVDAVSEVLQQRCGTFCSPDDVILYKAIEHVRKSSETSDINERNMLLRESLRLFSKVARILSQEKLQEVCEEYKAVKFHIGAVELALVCAREIDPTDKAKSYIAEGAPPADSRAEFYEKRKRCYECVFSVLRDVNEMVGRSREPAKAVPGGARPQMDDLEGFRIQVFQKALSSEDQLFHYSLYDWYISQGLQDQLLEAQPPFLEGYLKQDPSTIAKSDMLWRYYVRGRAPAKAAAVLEKLAESEAFGIPLEKRVEYIARAVANARSDPNLKRQDQLTQLEEKLEVAQVQMDIYNTIKQRAGYETYLDELQSRLFDITELYKRFANPLKLHEMILLILYVADFKDTYLLNQTWNEIIKKTHDDVVRDNLLRPYEALSLKVRELGSRFYPSETVFPLGTLVAILEKYSFQNKDDVEKGWVVRTMRDVGVPYDVLFDVFHDLSEGKLPPWQGLVALAFLVNDIGFLINEWINYVNNPATSVSERESFPVKAIDDAINKYIVLLDSIPAMKEALQDLQRRIRALA